MKKLSWKTIGVIILVWVCMIGLIAFITLWPQLTMPLVWSFIFIGCNVILYDLLKDRLKQPFAVLVFREFIEIPKCIQRAYVCPLSQRECGIREEKRYYLQPWHAALRYYMQYPSEAIARNSLCGEIRLSQWWYHRLLRPTSPQSEFQPMYINSRYDIMVLSKGKQNERAVSG